MKIALFILFFCSITTADAKPIDPQMGLTIRPTNDEELQYTKIVKKADECFDNQQYEKALELYKRAHLFRKKDKYVIKRIRETKQKIRQSNRHTKSSSTIQNEN